MTIRFLLVALVSLIGLGTLQAQGLNLQVEPKSDEGAMIEFEKTDYDLGDFTQGEEITIDIPFKSVGSEDLEVEHVKPSCSCSELTWTEKPLASGQSGNIHAQIATDEMEVGEKTKYFTVIYNGNPGVERVKVRFVLQEVKKEG